LAPPAIRVGARGRFAAVETGDDVVLKGINWFGHNVGQYNVDGLWAYCDDNYTASEPPCAQDGEIPPYHPQPAIGAEGVAPLGGINFWGKRTLTNDFATVVHRMKLLGFNTVRLPFTFAELNDDLPGTSAGGVGGEFFPCMRDDAAAVALRTIDPLLVAQLKPGATFKAPAVRLCFFWGG
jgi:aryl-phospho-beta-D-glucosidase BglC (GH1 family)